MSDGYCTRGKAIIGIGMKHVATEGTEITEDEHLSVISVPSVAKMNQISVRNR